MKAKLVAMALYSIGYFSVPKLAVPSSMLVSKSNLYLKPNVVFNTKGK